MEYWERRVRYGTLLEHKKGEWQNEEEEKLSHIVMQKETKMLWEAIRKIV